MPIRHLTLAIALALGSVSVPLLIQPAAAAISMEQEALASTVESRFNNLIKLNSEYYDLILGSEAMVERVSHEVTSYERNESGAKAMTTLTLEFNPVVVKNGDIPKVITLNLDNDIAYNDDLLSQDVIADIKTTLVTDEAFQQLADIDDEDLNTLKEALEYVDIQSQLLPEGEYTNHIAVKPFNVSEDGETIDFQGLTFDSSGNEADILYAAGAAHLDVKKLSVVNEYEVDQGEVIDVQRDTLTLEPFTSDITLTKDGDLTFAASTLTLAVTDAYEDMLFNIDSITGEGSEVFFDKDIATFTGKQHYRAENVSIQDLIYDKAFIANSVDFSYDITKENALYNTESELVVDLDAESFSSLTQLPNLQVNTITFSGTTQRISADAYQEMNNFGLLAAEDGEEAFKTALQTLLSDLARTEGALQIKLGIDTDQGSATFASDVTVKKDAVSDVQAWKDATEAEGPGLFISLLEKSINFDLKGSVSQDIIDALGLRDMMAMTVGYVVQEGGTYSIHLESKGDGIKLNGNAIPLPQR
ncbi:YdgA family protein [Suttonella sp. R2A3]|uniref:DUF945 family protein n=1 Tax=Suttonella sp. R2A3 TaxID=2908648 RepID=UPI001F3432A9|nr:DUF945 family protein [Suttonella sp. R2A3]UJF24106.1 YdgA family protein [Suttonella sp. R2A3]